MNKQEQQEAVISKYIHGNPPATMYDIGVGNKSEWKTLGAIYPEMKIYGCEPLAEYIPELDDFNHPLFRFAITGSTGYRTIYFDPSDMKTASLTKCKSAKMKKQVQTITLDQFDQIQEKPKRILLWMDIEGSELIALKSGRELLESHRVRWINLEVRRAGFERAGWCSAKEINDFLEGFGYKKVTEYNRHHEHMDVIYVNRGELKS